MNPTIDTNTIGSVGSVVGAALESSGHYMQSEALHLIDAGLGSSLGALLYIIAGISGVLLVTVGGNYKYGLWFILGPALFYWVVATRVESSGAEWRLGTRLWSQDYVRTTAYRSIDPGLKMESGEPVEVAWIFAEWNKLTSAIVQNFVAALDITDDKFTDLNFLARSDRYQALMNFQVSSPEISLFTDIALGAECGDFYAVLQGIYSPEVDIGRRKIMQEMYQKLRAAKGTKPVFSLNDHVKLRDWLKGSDYWTEVRKTTKWPDDKSRFSCLELWKMAVLIYRLHASELINVVIDNGRLNEMPRDVVKKDLLLKWKGSTDLEDNSRISVTDDDAQAFLYMINEVGGRMLLRKLGAINYSTAQRALGQVPQEWNEGGQAHVQEASRAIRNLSQGLEYQEKGDFLTDMLSLPYLQGMGLFFLSLTFPFFAMALVIPGREGTFLLWFGLWFWLKSWDIGMALVMFVDKILYVLMPHGPAVSEADLLDPAQAMKTMLQVDSTYSVYIYYNMLATLIAAVPVISGILVRKGGGEIANAISQGFSNFGGRVGASMSQYHRSMMGQTMVGDARMHILNSVRNSVGKALEQSGLAQHVGKAGVAQISKAVVSAGRNHGVWGATKTLAGVLGNAESSRQLNIGLAKFNAELNKTAFIASSDAYVRGKEAEGTAMGTYSRRLTRPYVGQDLLDILKEEQHPRIGDSADGIIRNTLIGGFSKGGGSLNLLDKIRKALPPLLGGDSDDEISHSVPPSVNIPAVNASSNLAVGSHNISSQNTSVGNSKSALIDATLREADAQGLTPEQKVALLAIVEQESSWRPYVKNPDSSAGGLFQFIDKTWAKVHEHMEGAGIFNGSVPSKYDAMANIRAGVFHFKENYALADSKWGVDGSDIADITAKVYAYHHDGPSLSYGGLSMGYNQVVPRVRRYVAVVRDSLNEG